MLPILLLKFVLVQWSKHCKRAVSLNDSLCFPFLDGVEHFCIWGGGGWESRLGAQHPACEGAVIQQDEPEKRPDAAKQHPEGGVSGWV